MEQERQSETPPPCPTEAETKIDPSLDETRVRLENILDAADRALDAIRPVHAEEYLQQNRQRSAQ